MTKGQKNKLTPIQLWPELEKIIDRKLGKYNISFYIWQCPRCLRTHLCTTTEQRACNGRSSVDEYYVRTERSKFLFSERGYHPIETMVKRQVR